MQNCEKYYWYHVRNPFWLKNFGFWQSFRSFFCVKPSSWLNFIWNKTTSSKNKIIINSIVHDYIKTQKACPPMFLTSILNGMSFQCEHGNVDKPKIGNLCQCKWKPNHISHSPSMSICHIQKVNCVSFIFNLLAKYINSIQIIEYSKHCIHMILRKCKTLLDIPYIYWVNACSVKGIEFRFRLYLNYEIQG